MLSATLVTMVACMALLAGTICMMLHITSDVSGTTIVPATVAVAADAVHNMSGFCKADDMELSMGLFAAVSTADSEAVRILMLEAAAC